MAGYMKSSPYRLGICQTVAIGAAHAESTAQAAPFHAVLLRATSNCHIRIGNAGTTAAVAADTPLLATDPPMLFMCSPGEVVSVIQDSAVGTLYVTPLTH